MEKCVEWIVVGAGPAGLASVGKLLDAGVSPFEITWIDPHFKVGDFGTLWRNVGSNTPVDSFLQFYRNVNVFQYDDVRANFMIDRISPEKNCPLIIAAQPLRWMTELLCQKITVIKAMVVSIRPIKNVWQLMLRDGQTLSAKKIILAIGGDAKTMHFDQLTAEVIPLSVALNPFELKQYIQPHDRVVVFGAAQSAKSVILNLSSIPTKKTILFYRTENTFLRHFDHVEFSSIQPVEITPSNLLKEMPQATKIIYAIGFDRRHIPIAGLPVDYDYDKKTGEIAPRLFGIGMGFPEIRSHEFGKEKYAVTAIYPFVKRLDRLLSVWLR